MDRHVAFPQMRKKELAFFLYLWTFRFLICILGTYCDLQQNPILLIFRCSCAKNVNAASSKERHIKSLVAWKGGLSLAGTCLDPVCAITTSSSCRFLTPFLLLLTQFHLYLIPSLPYLVLWACQSLVVELYCSVGKMCCIHHWRSFHKAEMPSTVVSLCMTMLIAIFKIKLSRFWPWSIQISPTWLFAHTRDRHSQRMREPRYSNCPVNIHKKAEFL